MGILGDPGIGVPRGDTAVVVLAIDFNDPDPRAVGRFVAQHHLLFPTLVDDDYVDKLPVHAYPTTWFVDRAGRVAFIRLGLREKLPEEFGWRIDMLRH